MKTSILLFLAMCLSAAAAIPPLPIKRPSPLLSPKHAAAPRTTPMLRQTLSGGGGGTENPRLPMKAYVVKVNGQYGSYEFTAEALQPANQSVLFEVSADMAEGTWITLAWFGPYAQGQVFATYPSDLPFAFIRATAGVEPSATMSRVVVSSPLGIRVNPDAHGVRAWRGVR